MEVIHSDRKNPIYRWGRLGDNDSMKQFKQPAGHFTPYDDGYPKVTPDTSTPLKKAVIAFEDTIRNDTGLETGAFFNEDGFFALGPKTGKPDRVGFSVYDLKRLAGKVYSHNHPSGSSFSLDDVAIAAEFNLSEARAVTDLFRHSISAKSWPDVSVLEQTFIDARQSAETEAMESIRIGELRRLNFGIELAHKTWVKVASRLLLNYTREKS